MAIECFFFAMFLPIYSVFGGKFDTSAQLKKKLNISANNWWILKTQNAISSSASAAFTPLEEVIADINFRLLATPEPAADGLYGGSEQKWAQRLHPGTEFGFCATEGMVVVSLNSATRIQVFWIAVRCARESYVRAVEVKKLV